MSIGEAAARRCQKHPPERHTRLLTFDKLILSETEDTEVLDQIGEWLEWIDE